MSAKAKKVAATLLKDDLRNVLDAHPVFRESFWGLAEDDRDKLTKAWVEKYEKEEYDYSGQSKGLREWVEGLVDKGAFEAEVPDVGRSEFSVGEEVLCRDKGEEWVRGVVKQIAPLRVMPRGGSKKNWRDGAWDEVKRENFTRGETVRVRDSVEGNWARGTVKGLDPLRVTPVGGDGAHEYKFVENIPSLTTETVGEEFECIICSEMGQDKAVRSCGETHYAHPTCMEKWFETTPSCPICRGTTSSVRHHSDPALHIATVRGSDEWYRYATPPVPGADYVDLITPSNDRRRVPAKDVLSPYRPPTLGDNVTVFGMREEPGLNGKPGLCIGYYKDRVVLFVGEERVALKIVNLRLQ